MSDLPYEAAISLTVTMRGGYKIDLDVTNPVAVDDLVASLNRAGITHLICETSHFVRDEDGGTETLQFSAIIQTS